VSSDRRRSRRRFERFGDVRANRVWAVDERRAALDDHARGKDHLGEQLLVEREALEHGGKLDRKRSVANVDIHHALVVRFVLMVADCGVKMAGVMVVVIIVVIVVMLVMRQRGDVKVPALGRALYRDAEALENQR